MLGLQAPLLTLINVSSFGISIRWQSSLPADACFKLTVYRSMVRKLLNLIGITCVVSP